MSQHDHIVVAMSGGVDSSVAALLLQRQGHQVTGAFMHNWGDADGACTAREDFFDALAVCEQLGIELLALNLSATYRERVFSRFLRECRAGRTPNPDVLCNSEIKFSAFAETVMAQTGVRHMATGHYARTANGRLLRGLDDSKDQSYFLCRVTSTQLQRTLFPVGGLRKTAVREIARSAGLATAEKRDSTGICFIGERHFREFLSQHLPEHPGPMLTEHGHCIGAHRGLAFYTIGQRQGLGIGGLARCPDAPWYIAAKDVSKNALILVQGSEHPLLYSETLTTLPVQWIDGAAASADFTCTAKTRYRQPDQACRVRQQLDGSLDISFEQPQRAVTPGQWVVLYRGEQCLGGAVIDSRGPAVGRATEPVMERLADVG